MFSYLVYTHEEYKDIFDIHLKRYYKFYSNNPPFVATNTKDYILQNYPEIPESNIIVYNDNDAYADKLTFILNSLKTDYVLLNHDPNIFVDNVNHSKLAEAFEEMKISNIDQVRLVVAGIDNPDFNDNKLLKKNNGWYYFSVISAIWKVSSLLQITNQFKGTGYRNMEAIEIQEYCSKFSMWYLSSSRDKLFTGEGHYLSYYFPIAHLTGSNKWRISTPMNREFADEISKEYNVDLNIRGIIYNVPVP